jgi:hypothetical protein
MSNEKKGLTLRIIFGVLVASVLLLGALTVIKVLEVKRLEKQVENVKTVNQSLLDSSVSEYVVLNFVDIDGSITPYLVNKNLGMSIYDFLLTTPDFEDSDFGSFDGTNYYFNSSTETHITGVVELEDNPNYYDTDWGFLIVGLQAIIINQNYTVVRSVYIPPAD